MPCLLRLHLGDLFLLLLIQTTLAFVKSQDTPELEKLKTMSTLKSEGKIIGGQPVPIEQYPYNVQSLNAGMLCAGSILTSWIVLTAAHCFDYNENTDFMEIHAGSRFSYDFTADAYDVWYFVKHTEYNKAQPFSCDIALMYVKRPIALNKRAQKAIIVNSNKWMVEGETNFTATGWGYTQPDGSISKHGLMMTQLMYVSLNKCMRLHNISMTPDMFCLYGDAQRDTCKGDSGGAVSWHGMIVGIVSHGDGCAQRGKPSVYANIWYFRGWILHKINKFRKYFCTKAKHDGILIPGKQGLRCKFAKTVMTRSETALRFG